MSNSDVVIVVGFLIFLGIGVGSMIVIRRRYFAEQAPEAATALIQAAEGFYLCGIPLKTWITKALPTRLVWFGVADFGRQFGELIVYALHQKGMMGSVYYKTEYGGGNNHHDVIIRFFYNGEWWQY